MQKIQIIKDVMVPNYILHDIYNNDTQILDYLDDKKDFFDPWFGEILNCSISTRDSWLNFTKYQPGTGNDFDWHNEKGKGVAEHIMDGDYSCVFWLSGDTNSGGGLSVLTDTSVEYFKFLPNTMIIFEADTFHKVEHYSGSSPRISLNFTFDILSKVVDKQAKRS